MTVSARGWDRSGEAPRNESEIKGLSVALAIEIASGGAVPPSLSPKPEAGPPVIRDEKYGQIPRPGASLLVEVR